MSLLYNQQEIAVYKKGQISSEIDNLVIEMPLTVLINGKEIATLSCSPGASLELGTGYLINEGWLQSPEQIKNIKADEEKGMFWLESFAQLSPDADPHGRYISETGDKSKPVPYFNKDARQIKPVDSVARFKASHLLRLIELLEDESQTFQLTGGVHSAALGDDHGLITRYEDIGRHNAVDKVIGYAFLNHIPLHDKCLVLSGRVATEILVKVARNGIPLLLSRSAAMHLAVQLAQEWNVCVVGFTRNQRFNIYSHRERILI
ncbi:MAG: formate dehydrogenase accessory sulfurtransferase FdhD [Syntrophomonadaceae bacterium]|nr:formate dehydrogenase accessory sulfurtransferase FdhD [Syntrophomonadaceae bacterium]